MSKILKAIARVYLTCAIAFYRKKQKNRHTSPMYGRFFYYLFFSLRLLRDTSIIM